MEFNEILKKTKIDLNNILIKKHIKKGFTNEIFYVKDKQKNEYKIRIAAQNPYINRNLEKEIEFQLFKENIIYYDDEGNFVKKWVFGKELKKENLNSLVIENILKIIKKIQNIQIFNSEIKEPVYYLNNIKVDKHLKKPLDTYKKIIKSFKKEEFVLAHNDFSSANLIIFKDKLTIMDFEWSVLNQKDWDLANLVKDLELTNEEVNFHFEAIYKNKLNFFKKVVFCTYFYTFFWTYKVDNTAKIENYRKSIVYMILYWFDFIEI